MSTFTAVGNWSAQGVVEGVVTFTPRPAAAGTPVQGTTNLQRERGSHDRGRKRLGR
ncbi:hypothetical protein H8Z51_12260 [Mycobacterium avium subsp. hominissuis]|uniref:hypothetical protein n=1 Tax=Mycobacterium avium TaxID=1764 RepID=UPI0015E1C0D1|nr:hypothetical protein [Mycobacterium avium]MCA4759545.1 hypothetical protein [Mycobacterium avium subsp. hominissuis]